MRLTFMLLNLAVLMAQGPNVPVENEYVRVVLATDEPAAKPGPLHEHKQNRVMIYRDAGDIQIKYADGRVDNQHWKKGDVAWSLAGGMHTSQNVSPKTVRIVEIEVRSAGAKGNAERRSRPGHPVIDNPQVVVYRGSKPSGGRHYVAVDVDTGSVLWDKMPEGAGPFVISQLK
jgi:uncharacterized RmlC-like cupin family protein